MLIELYKTNNLEKNNKLVNVINGGLIDLKTEIKKMSDEERKIEKPDKLVEIVKKFLSLINKTKKEKS